MSLRQCFRALARINSNVWKPQLPTPNITKSAALNLIKSPEISFNHNSIGVVVIPGMNISQKIVDPLSMYRLRIGIPVPNCNEVSLPQHIKSEVTEPLSEDIIEKKAARLIVIRRAKMKKHKWRKLQKKMKFVFAKKRQRKEMKKEKAFQAMLLAKIKEAEKFDAEEYVANKLKVAHWEKPITRVRGFYAPDWVIRDHLRAQEEKIRLDQRIADCLRFKK